MSLESRTDLRDETSWPSSRCFPGRTRHRLPLILKSIALLALAGCTSMGPRAIKGERINYNVALQQTNDEQILLNLVRLKYRDTPIFLNVNGITTQFSFEASVAAGAELEESADKVFTFGGSAGYSTKPTVTYSPIQGQEFAERLMSPLSLDTMMLLYRSGWSLKRVVRLCVQKLNGLENAPRASGPTPERAPKYEEFNRALDLMRGLQNQRLLDLTYETFPAEDRPPRFVLAIRQAAWDLPEALELANLLRLAKHKRHYPLIYSTIIHEGPGELDYVTVEARSLSGILFFLSESVQVPRKHQEEGRVTITRYKTGEPFDWRQVTGDLLRVESQASKPGHAAVATRYRGRWFFIDDTDLESKSTFCLLTQLFALQSRIREGMVPVLTLPVGK